MMYDLQRCRCWIEYDGMYVCRLNTQNSCATYKVFDSSARENKVFAQWNSVLAFSVLFMTQCVFQPTHRHSCLFVIHVIFHVLLERLYCSYARLFVTQAGLLIVIYLDVTGKWIQTDICLYSDSPDVKTYSIQSLCH